MKELIKLAHIIKFPVKKYLVLYIWCMLCAVLYTCCALVFPGIVGMVIDNGISSNSFAVVLDNAVWLLILGALMIFFQYLQKISFAKLSQGIVVDIQTKLMDKITKSNYCFWKRHKSGDVYAVIEKDVNKLESLLSSALNDAIISILVAIGVAMYLLFIDKVIGGIVIVLALLFSYIQRYAGKRGKAEMLILRNLLGKVSSFTNNIVNNSLSIRLMGISNKMLHNYNKEIKNYREQYIKQIKIMNIVQATGMAFNSIGLFIILVMGSLRIFNNQLSVGILFSLTIYLQRLYNPIVSLGNLYVSMKSITPIVNKITEILDNKDVINSGDYSSMTPLTGEIIMRDIFFIYQDSICPVFNMLTLKISPGEKVGMIGKNGSGKTSIIRLLSKMCTPNKGTILLDGIDINSYDDNYIFKQIGIMSQENYLPSWSLWDIFEADKQDESKIVGLMKFLNFPIEKLPYGLNSIIGENRISLSGGEIQKIAFIRLLLQNKQIYIFDEPTAALDIDSEKKMVQLIESELYQKTCLIITHRKEVLKICDRVIELQLQAPAGTVASSHAG